ncbi:MAG: hypothetical protein ILP11_04475 [Alphaproteobacteria bacterium]|nr:hypothetical protein [Alphaproteobacteria bacterium]
MLNNILFLLSLSVTLACIFVLLCIVWYVALPIFLVLLLIFFISSAWHSYQLKKTFKAWQDALTKTMRPHKKRGQDKVIDVDFKEL